MRYTPSLHRLLFGWITLGGIIAALVGAAGGAFFNHAFGGGGGNTGSGGGSSPFTPYSPTGLAGQDTNYQNLMQQQLTDFGLMSGQTVGQLSPLYQQLVGNLGSQAPAIEHEAGNMAGYYGNMATEADALHNLMTGIGNTDLAMQGQLAGAGMNAWNTALDPQNALYNRTQQQVQDQSRANVSASGLGTSPYGVGLENQANSNFNIDWQNQQLQRQLSGLQGLGQAETQAGRMGEAASQQYTGAQAMSNLAPQLAMQSVNLPYQTTAGLINQGFTNAQDFTNAMTGTQFGPTASMMSEIIPYLNYGAGAQANTFNAGQANLQNAFGIGGMLTNQYGQGPGGGYGPIGSGLNYLTQMFNNPFGSGGGGGNTNSGSYNTFSGSPGTWT